MRHAFLVAALLCLHFSVGCATRKTTRSVGPDLSAAITANQGIIDNLTAAQQDDKAVKKAITALQASNLALHKLHGDMTSNLDRADYKTSILLK